MRRLFESKDPIAKLKALYQAGIVDGIKGMKGEKEGYRFGDLIDINGELQMVVDVEYENLNDGFGDYELIVLLHTDHNGYVEGIGINISGPPDEGHITDQ